MLDLQLRTVDVMDNIVFNTISEYYKVLQRRGYHSYADVKKILVLSFYWNFVTSDYRGLIRKEDYSLIERALNCLFGSTCLIPYPDYLKMNKLHLGQVTEIAQRMKKIEDTPVLKLIHDTSIVPDPQSDILIVEKDGDGEVIVGSL